MSDTASQTQSEFESACIAWRSWVRDRLLDEEYEYVGYYATEEFTVIDPESEAAKAALGDASAEVLHAAWAHVRDSYDLALPFRDGTWSDPAPEILDDAIERVRWALRSGRPLIPIPAP